jgi:hypothetical protein
MLFQATLMKGTNQTHKMALSPSKGLATNSMHDFHGIQLLIVFLKLSELGEYAPKNRAPQQDNPLISKNKIQPMVAF